MKTIKSFYTTHATHGAEQCKDATVLLKNYLNEILCKREEQLDVFYRICSQRIQKTELSQESINYFFQDILAMRKAEIEYINTICSKEMTNASLKKYLKKLIAQRKKEANLLSDINNKKCETQNKQRSEEIEDESSEISQAEPEMCIKVKNEVELSSLDVDDVLVTNE